MFWQLEIAALIENEAARRGKAPGDDEIEWLSRQAWDQTRQRTALDVHRARAVQNRLSRVMAERFKQIDILVTPTIASRPPLIGGFASSTTCDIDSWSREAYAFAPFTEIFNLTGQPALSIPAGTFSDGLPIGVQLVGRFGDEATVLGIGYALMRENPTMCS